MLPTSPKTSPRTLRETARARSLPWEFFERFAQKASITPEMATRYARHVGDILGDAVPEEELAAMHEELPPGYWELSERVLTDPHPYGSFERRPNSLPSTAPVPDEN